MEARALLGRGEPESARQVADRFVTGPRRHLLLAHVAAAAARPHDVDRLLRDRSSWTVPERLEADVVRAAAARNAQAEADLAAVLTRAASAGWVSPFVGQPTLVARLLERLPVGELHAALATALRRANPARAAVAVAEELTPRERTILELLPSYMSYAQIGERLYLSINTVKGNLKTIYRKLSVTSRSEAVEAARRAGLL